jgi:hypothetical protein
MEKMGQDAKCAVELDKDSMKVRGEVYAWSGRMSVPMQIKCAKRRQAT